MKLNIKRVPLIGKVLISIILLFILFWVIIFAKVQYEKSLMKPLKTGKITSDIYAVNDSFVNLYLIKGNKGYIMIDAGNDKGDVIEALENLKISPEEIQIVLLTHSDNDHVSSIKAYTKAEIYLSNLEVQMVDGSVKRNLIGRKNNLDYPYKILKDGDSFEKNGVSIKCISTPGHTLGSMSYLINDKYLFVGDTMSLQNGKVELFNSFLNMDDERQKESLKKLANIKDIKYIFTGHYGYTSNTYNAFDKWKDK